MAEYNYKVRDRIRNNINDLLKKKTSKLSGKEKLIANEIQIDGVYNADSKNIKAFEDMFFNNPSLSLKECFQKDYSALVKTYVPTDKQKEFYYIVEQLNNFPYTRGYDRRTLRTKNAGAYARIALRVMHSYFRYFYVKGTVYDDIVSNYDDEMYKYYANEQVIEYQIAAAIDLDGGKTAQAIKDAVNSENNNVVVTREMIKGVFMSKNTELHALMGDFLLAAKLQEGLRQSICESMDEGRPEAFKTMLKVIEDNNLIRYSSVKRAISTWIGICDESNVDRINQKMLVLMSQAVNDDKKRKEYLNSNDTIELSVGLWATSFYEVEDAKKEMKRLIKKGTKNQRLTVSYFNDSLKISKFQSEIATLAIEEYHEELDTMACFLPNYIPNVGHTIYQILGGNNSTSAVDDGSYEPKKQKITDYFVDRKQLEKHYNIFLDIYNRIPKKEIIFSPCIFPWYATKLKKSDLIKLLCLLAYISGDDDKIDFATTIVGDIENRAWGSDRSDAVNLVLAHPKNQEQKTRLIKFIGNPEAYTSKRAYSMVEKMDLNEDDYAIIVDMLRFKRSSLRSDLIKLIMKQEDTALVKSINGLIKDKKEDKRTAALDMIMQLSQDKKRKKAYEEVKDLPKTIKKPTSKEKILIDQLTGENNLAIQIVNEKGLGIYDPDEEFDFIDTISKEKEPSAKEMYKLWFPTTEKEIIKILDKLDAFIDEHADYEYECEYDGKKLFGNTYIVLKDYNKGDKKPLDQYPLGDELRKFYKKEIKRYDILLQIFDYRCINKSRKYEDGKDWYKIIFNQIPYSKKLPHTEKYESTISTIIRTFKEEYRDKKYLFNRACKMNSKILHNLHDQNWNITYEAMGGYQNKKFMARVLISHLDIIDYGLGNLIHYSNDKEFEKAFKLTCAIEEKCKEEDCGPFKRGYYHSDKTYYFDSEERDNLITGINTEMVIEAYDLGIISKNMLLKTIIENLDIYNFMRKISNFMHCMRLIKRGGDFGYDDKRIITDCLGKEYWEEKEKLNYQKILKTNKRAKTFCELYDQLTPVITSVELKRGDTPTPFSGVAAAIKYIEGVDYLVEILKALGKDTLDRSGYWYWGADKNSSKKENLSHLLRCCYPKDGETSKTLAKKLKGSGISDERLVQTAMYANQWIDIIEEYLGWKGMKSGCYYFMAHMNERLDDAKAAIIAKYTPLTPEELRDGAFDIDWFKETYKALGKKRFGLLYDSAKYIADGNMHTRGRKYADATTGVVKLKEVKKQIMDKRNKDLLMSYALIPLRKGGKDLLSRYEYIEQFRKESKQFGSQRQTSEGRACDMALTNLSKNAGYSDVTRLILSMETKLMEQFKAYMEWKTIGDVAIRIQIDEKGTSKLEYKKGEKMLKSLPAKINKNPYVLEIKDVHKKLKNQYSRTRQMMENAMENGTTFKVSEIKELFTNPIAKAIIKDLVFKSGNKLGFVNAEGKLVTYSNRKTTLNDDDDLIIAHPLHLFKAKVWHEYQKYLFDHEIKQNFKQVFRELYVKLDEEKDLYESKMFAGNQIQPRKTVGCLKSRKWIADYEDGLQKVYYKDNIIARIYAQADWFSPSDIEEPTLEWVEFSDRKTFKPIKIKDIPDVIYSEVMRDVDLAVSVAHAGGVDPETSHSTMEMRKAIIEFNLPLLQINNVTFKDNHAIIKGSIGKYSVHLGSGVVHQMGGAMVNVLPVHSQNRGKLFLPFIDEDPKTAEIMSKIVLFSEDDKIKDPIILEQIKR